MVLEILWPGKQIKRQGQVNISNLMLIYNLMIEKNIQLQWFSLIASGIFPAETTEAHSFIARLGQIFDMRSDNGTNLIGAETNH